MVSTLLNSPHEVMQNIAKQAKQARLNLNLSQTSLSARSGVSYGTLKKFEQTGKISIESLLKVALILGELDAVNQLFIHTASKLPDSLDQLLEINTRKRGRK